ncbi:hypothetical protein GCM10027418_25460 [Mariniluteicoccus endophyticus]
MTATPTRTPSATPTPSAPAAQPPATPTAAPTSTAAPSPTATSPATTAIAAKRAQTAWLGDPVGPEAAIANGRMQQYANGVIYWSQTTGAHWSRGPILERYKGMQAADGWLGFPTTDEFVGSTGAVVQKFSNGLMIFTPEGGAQPVGGAILLRYADLNWENGPVGAPHTGELPLPSGVIIQMFKGGQAFYTAKTGAHFTYGLIHQAYVNTGLENGPLGLPVTDEFAGARGSRVQNFEHGQIIWSPETGAHAIYGEIQRVYASLGWEGGVLGRPITPEFDGSRGTRVQNFEGGQIIWSPQNGAHAVYGAIQQEYANLRWEGGVLGRPITDEFQGARGSRVQNFEHGQIIWSPETGAHAVFGAIQQTYANMRWEGGVLGRPITNEFPGARGSIVQNFEFGQIIWSPQTGAQPVFGAIAGTFARLGWEGGTLGRPLSGEYIAGSGAVLQNFEFGMVYWTPGTGANAIYGEILMQYADQGYDNGPLGVPINLEYNGAPGARVQNFTGGIIVWTPRTGSWSVRGKMLEGFGNYGYEGGHLGAPRSNEYTVPGGWAQDFEKGRLQFINGRFSVVWPGPNVDPRCRYGRVMCVSKADRKLRWMIDGVVIREMDARFGAAGTPTREGEFKVFSKVRNEVSWMYGNTPMPFAMYFSGGEAVHYSYDFAKYGYSKSAFASHGCVNIRDWDGIQWLYDTQVRLGDRVVVYW